MKEQDSGGGFFLCLQAVALAVCLSIAPSVCAALTTTFSSPDASDELKDRLQSASSIMAAEANGLDTAQELIAASLSDYKTLVQVLYDEGFFSPIVNVKINGREAATIPALDPPSVINSVEILVRTGKPFVFGKASVAPLAPETELPAEFGPNQPAKTGIISDAATAGVKRWRELGYAKAAVGDQRIVANHDQAVLDTEITLVPGPELAFGKMTIPENSSVRPEAIAKIAGFPTGETYEPAKVQKVGTRLRRTGAFSSVSLREAELPNPDGTLDFELETIDEIPRRISFGAEISSRNGLDLSAKWTHRNLFGAAERFQVEARVRNIGGDEDIDGLISLRLDQPATMGPDDNLFYLALLERENKPHYNLTRGYLGFGIRRVFSDDLFSELSVSGGLSRSTDAFTRLAGVKYRDFHMIPFTLRTQWDKRDNRVSATKGFYLDTLFTPYVGYSGTESGVSAYVDARGYISPLSSDTIVLAGRVQVGTVVGPSLPEISPEFLFYSGGAGTVRGQPYQSLGIPIGNDVSGGRSLLAMSAEVRGRVTDSISLVGFFDYGAVASNQFVDGNSEYHTGAGLGVRYDLGGFGPLRFDLGYPIDGPTGDGLQFYLGIGQAF